MAYDAAKDKELANWDLGQIVVTVNQYNGGEPKVGISRKYEKNGEERLMRSGRLTMEEYADVVAHSDEIMAAAGKGKKTTKKTTKKSKDSE